MLLAGDAAHIHYPAGGQGIGLGIQDAVNLGWKLAQVVNGISPESLLDTYHAERHPAGARALKHSMAQTVLQRMDARTAALAETVDELMSMDQPRTHVAALIHGLDIAYDLGEGHPLLGRRMPDLDLDTANGPTRVFTLLHDAKPVLLNLAEPASIEVTPWAERVHLVDARFTGTWHLPLLGEVTPPTAVLDPPGWACRLGGTGNRSRADGRAHPLVRPRAAGPMTMVSARVVIWPQPPQSTNSPCGMTGWIHISTTRCSPTNLRPTPSAPAR